MASGTTVKIDGLDELLADIEKMSNTVMPAMQAASEKGAQAVLFRARANLEFFNIFGSGQLSRSMKVTGGVITPNGSFVIHYVTWGNDVRDYAMPLELGHFLRHTKKGPIIGKVAPHPFLRPAADESKRNIRKWMVEAINKEIEKLGD